MSDDNNRKTIVISDSVLLGSHNKTKKNKKPKKEKPIAIIKPNQLKKDLIEKIKKYQQSEKIKNKFDDSNINDNHKLFTNNFMESLEYLNKLSVKEKANKKKHRNKTLKNPIHNTSTIPNISFKDEEPLVAVDLPLDFDNTYNNNNNSNNNIHNNNNVIHLNDMFAHNHMIPTPLISDTYVKPTTKNMTTPENIIRLDTPSYGCLKHGTKPTYRQFHNKTLKLNNHKTHYDTKTHTNNNNIHKRSRNLQQLKKTCNKYRQKTLRTRKRTYTLGKKHNNISILIKNNKTQRNIKKEHGLLKQKPLLEIKKYLYDRNLLKIGSSAPNDVLRTIYEQSILAGDINNNNNSITLHNFIQK